MIQQNSFFTPNCPDPQLRPNAQGIARVAVNDTAAQLLVTFEVPITLPQQNYLLNARSYSLSGGERLFPHVLSATLNPPGTPPELQNRLVQLDLDSIGDFSIYTLTVNGPDIDPFFSSHKLRFRVDCDAAFDCREPAPVPPPEPELAIAIDYVAKDYASFRQALLDFIPTRLPVWTERSEADIGMMLLELFAATADTLSYMQDRVANEAFLSSATQRRSVAEHLAVLGYQMDEGASAHTWLQFQVNTTSPVLLPAGFPVSTKPRGGNERIIVFETYTAATLRTEHNAIQIYDLGNTNCCLPGTSLSVALVGQYDQLKAGDYILFDEKDGHRDIVRLTGRPEVVPSNQIKARPDGPITVLRWSPQTPLRYDYCIQDTTVRANLVLATHGETIAGEDLRRLTDEQKAALDAEIAARKAGQRIPRQRLQLSRAPLAHIDTSTSTLVAPLNQTPSQPEVIVPRSVSTLELHVDGDVWQELPTLLDSGPNDQVYRLEIDDEGYATVVFGDGTFGKRPDETSTVTAFYRIGGGAAGNLSADTLILPQPGDTPVPWLVSVTNPLPATGGRDLESRDHARRFAPATFHKPLVAVTADDYRLIAQDFTDAQGQQPIQRASADFRWTGSWLTVDLTVDPGGVEALSADLRNTLLAFLDTRRLAGYDLEIRRAVYVSVDLVIAFCLAKGFLAGDVEQRLLQALSNSGLPGGQKGFFHPDNFSFGDTLYVSKLFATIMAVPGVESAQITRLTRSHSPRPASETSTNLRQGYLQVGPNEIIRLDNDRNLPQNGTLVLVPKGVG